MTGSVVIAGSLAQKPGNAGHTWQFLQYLLGFRELGWDVLFLDRLDGDMATDPTRGAAYLADVMAAHGLDGCWSLAVGGDTLGLARVDALDRVRGCDLLVNVMGFCEDEEILAAAPLRVFLDTDPGFGQMWADLGLADIFAGHDVHVTIAERIGEPDCTIPEVGRSWVTMRQPVVLSQWPATALPDHRRFTSVGSWRGAYGPIEHGGVTYGLRVHEFRRFAEVPRLTGGDFELALKIDPVEQADVDRLRAGGWSLVDPNAVVGAPDDYQRYIRGSFAELMIAKGIYVQTRGGWFSERSTCYLASGRPVIHQDTGLGDLLPLGEGLLAFSDVDEAVAAVEAVVAEPERHARAAREVAEACFDSAKVLDRLLAALPVR